MARSSRIIAPAGLALLAGICLGTPGAAVAQGFDGAYLGLYGATSEGTGVAAGGFGGYRFEFTDSTYLGAELDILFPSGPTDVLAAGLGSLGYEVLPDTLVYGHAGFALDDGANTFWVAGGGIEHAVTEGFSLRLGGDRYEDLGGAAGDWVAKAGVALRF